MRYLRTHEEHKGETIKSIYTLRYKPFFKEIRKKGLYYEFYYVEYVDHTDRYIIKITPNGHRDGSLEELKKIFEDKYYDIGKVDDIRLIWNDIYEPDSFLMIKIIPEDISDSIDLGLL